MKQNLNLHLTDYLLFENYLKEIPSYNNLENIIKTNLL